VCGPVPGPDSGSPGIIERLYIPTDGTLAAENRVRTQVANLVPNAIIHSNRDLRDRNEFFPTDVARLVSIGCLFMLLVGALGLTAGMIAGLLERRRPFALLRASGVRIGELRRVVFLETAATMVFTSALGLGIGLVSSYAAMSDGPGDWRWPELTVFVYVGSGILAALLFSALALPLLGATTRHESVRYE
jgi:ABC-type antimicrobial peptide transport system permease subunit